LTGLFLAGHQDTCPEGPARPALLVIATTWVRFHKKHVFFVDAISFLGGLGFNRGRVSRGRFNQLAPATRLLTLGQFLLSKNHNPKSRSFPSRLAWKTVLLL
jgi:hypothetical protein